MYSSGRDVDIVVEQPQGQCGSGSSAGWWVLAFFCLIFIIFGCYAGYSEDNRNQIALQCQQFAEKAQPHVDSVKAKVQDFIEQTKAKTAAKSPTTETEAVSLAEATVQGETLSGTAVSAKMYSGANDKLQYVNPQACPKGDIIHMPKTTGNVESASGQMKKGVTVNEDKQITNIRQLRQKIDSAITVDRDFILDRDGTNRFLGPLSFNRPLLLDWQRLRQKVRNERDQKTDCGYAEFNGSSWLS